MEPEEVHVLMVSLSAQGHLNPMLRFAKCLSAKGIHVTLATNDAIRDLILKSNISETSNTTQYSSNQAPRISLEFFSDGLSPEFDRSKDLDFFVETVRTRGSKNLSNLITDLTANGKKFTCIISNPFVPCVPDIAAEHGIPCAMLWIQASSVYSIYYHYFKYPNLFPSLENPDETIELPGMPVLQVRDLPTFLLPSNNFVVLTRQLSDFFKNLDKVKWVFGNSFNELEEEVVKSMASLHPIYPIGPLVSPFLLGKEESVGSNVDMWTAEDSCLEWLDKQPPSSVIYISFGSVLLLSQEQMDSLAIGIKNSNKPVLWVIKPPKKGSDRKYGELSSKFLEETKGRVLVVSWSPQEKVLMHPSLAGFVTHCGWNSTLETVVAGVPVITYPEWTDQTTDAKLLVDVFKIGVRTKLDNGVATVEEVERCVTEITDGPNALKLKKRALVLREAAKKEVADGGSSDKNIDQFISEIIGKS